MRSDERLRQTITSSILKHPKSMFLAASPAADRVIESGCFLATSDSVICTRGCAHRVAGGTTIWEFHYNWRIPVSSRKRFHPVFPSYGIPFQGATDEKAHGSDLFAFGSCNDGCRLRAIAVTTIRNYRNQSGPIDRSGNRACRDKPDGLNPG